VSGYVYRVHTRPNEKTNDVSNEAVCGEYPMSESIDVHAKERAAREAGATEGQRDEGVYSQASAPQR